MSKVLLFLLTGLMIIGALTGCRSAHTTAAILYIDEQSYEKAVNVIHEGFQYRDDEPDAYYYLGEAYGYLAEIAVEEDNFPEAGKNFSLAYEAYMHTLEINSEEWSEKVLSSLNINYSNRIRQASRDWDEDYFEQAEGHLRLAYAAMPDSLTPIKNIARMKIGMANKEEFVENRAELLEEALGLLNTVIDENPEAYGLQVNKADVLFSLDRNSEAAVIYDNLLKDHGDDTGLLSDIARMSIQDGDLERAGDLYLRIVDLNEADTDPANDSNNKDMLVAAGTYWGLPQTKRFEDAILILDRAANLELTPLKETMKVRLQTYYNYASDLAGLSKDETDEVAKADLAVRSQTLFQRAVEIGNAMVLNFPFEKDGFFYLSGAQQNLGDYTAAEANFKTFQELNANSE